ncbi:MAG TPA: mechanosensitive ion channel family protein [Acidimicrobiales bacterium]|nr:mechanosensitive ion channel family protein [Acidimicrobiales bacterium]
MLAADNGYIYDLLVKLGLTEFAARTTEFILVRPLKILLIVGVGMIAGRIAGRAVRKFVRTGYHRTPVRPQTPRASLRADTVGDVAASFTRGVVMAVAILIVLDQLGINLAPLLAGAGIAGLAVGFGAQSLVKDVISGLFVIIEDQYGVGDVVTLGESTGTVEDVTLRVTRLRSADGTVWFVPNGEIRRVGNSSMEWSRALIDVIVAYDVDVQRAAAVILEEANALAEEPAWRESTLEPPEMWGVQAMDKDGITLRLVVKTPPRAQFALARELRTRSTQRLLREGFRRPGQGLAGTEL